MNTLRVCALPFALLLSCGGDDPREALPDWTDGYEEGPGTGGGSSKGGGGTMSLTVPEGTGIPMRLYKQGTKQDCGIEFDGTPEGRQEIICQLEIKELDLWGQGLQFDFHARGCEYFEHWWYQYEAFETGVGPTDVSYTVDADGNFTNEVNSIGGEPYCPYDHSWTDPDWPNCCDGSYTLTVTDSAGGVTVDPPTTWSDELSKCFDGAAFADKNARLDEDGWPLAVLVFLAGGVYEEHFDLGSISDRYATNVPYANYYDPLDHDGTAPAGLREDLQPWPIVPYYNFVCSDDAGEVFGSIRLVVREWNELKEFFAEDGDPDTEGVEPGTDYPINDIQDWKDATPGSTTWIEDRD